jgi:DNA anti-recombination protein RmuC
MIKLSKIKDIINEELAKVLLEEVDHNSIKEVVTAASKLLSSVEGFKKTAPQACLDAVGQSLDQMQKSLEDMLSNPSSYIPKKPTMKKVSLKAVSSESAKAKLNK